MGALEAVNSYMLLNFVAVLYGTQHVIIKTTIDKYQSASLVNLWQVQCHVCCWLAQAGVGLRRLTYANLVGSGHSCPGCCHSACLGSGFHLAVVVASGRSFPPCVRGQTELAIQCCWSGMIPVGGFGYPQRCSRLQHGEYGRSVGGHGARCGPGWSLGCIGCSGLDSSPSACSRQQPRAALSYCWLLSLPFLQPTATAHTTLHHHRPQLQLQGQAALSLYRTRIAHEGCPANTAALWRGWDR